MSTALYTGSFDPITKGHIDVITTASKMFEKVIVGVGSNPAKKYTFSLNERIKLIKDNVTHCLGIKGQFNPTNVTVVEIPNGRLTADYAYEHNATILKGVRMNAADFDYEWLMADINSAHVRGLKTVIIPATPEFNNVSSSTAKELTKLHGMVQDYVPLNVKAALEREIVKQHRVVVTGTIGSGKSTIVEELVRRYTQLSIHNIDLDVIAKEILFDRMEPAYVGLRRTLTHQLEVNHWNRGDVGKVVFKDPNKRKVLNEAIRQPLMTRIRSEVLGKTGIIIFNGALIVEAGWMHLANNNIIVLGVDNKNQRIRLKNRGYKPAQIKARVHAQLDTAAKISLIASQISKDGYGHAEHIDTSEVAIDHTIEHVHAKLVHSFGFTDQFGLK